MERPQGKVTRHLRQLRPEARERRSRRAVHRRRPPRRLLRLRADRGLEQLLQGHLQQVEARADRRSTWKLAPKWRLEFGGAGLFAPAAAEHRMEPRDAGPGRSQAVPGRHAAREPVEQRHRPGGRRSARRRCSSSLPSPQNMGPLFRFVPRFAAQAQLFKLDPSTVHLVTLSHDQIFVDSRDFSDAVHGDRLLRRHQRDPARADASRTRRSTTCSITRSSAPTASAPTISPWVIENKTSVDFTMKPSPSVVAAEHRRLLLPVLGRVGGRVARSRLPGDRSARHLGRRAAQRSVPGAVQQQRSDHVQLLPGRLVRRPRACSGSRT